MSWKRKEGKFVVNKLRKTLTDQALLQTVFYVLYVAEGLDPCQEVSDTAIPVSVTKGCRQGRSLAMSTFGAGGPILLWQPEQRRRSKHRRTLPHVCDFVLISTIVDLKACTVFPA